ncbi:lysophospholipid acyltransferase family protein [Salidesulfovibrio onnuriiensis]|uniref:lysophospholipid acyltransferase family protein n=1 Tax=Salidesulfovibrio onnuriiensis TaxID=2583823 RepID=UPI0011C9C252|nr:lysophospholipid acyltransferase family protein [Salidesulfovibrio onnuriiensis]
MKIPIDPLRLTPAVAGLYKLWIRSLRLEDLGGWEKIGSLHEAGHPLVLCLWHEEIFALTGYGWTRTQDVVTFVSQSKDGEFITRVLLSLGHVPVRGSSTRGGVRALLGAKRIMERENRMAVFTIDGPRGPRRVPKDGPIFLAQRAGAKIVPMRAFPRRKHVFEKSWDHFQVPYPFTSCQIRIGDPYDVTTEKLTEDVMERERERLRLAMENITP